jgi:hypothetical protein
LTKKQFLHLLDQKIPNRCFVLSPCAANISWKPFDIHLVRGHIGLRKTGKLGHLQPLTKGNPSFAGKNIDHLALMYNDHWLVLQKETQAMWEKMYTVLHCRIMTTGL